MNRTEQVSGISRDLQRLAHGSEILVVADGKTLLRDGVVLEENL